MRERPRNDERAGARRPERPLADGTVTRLAVQAKNPERVSVYLDGQFAFGLYRDTLVAFGLRKGVALDVAAQERIRAADEVLVAKARAMHYLAHRARTEHEVRQKLLKTGFGEAAVDAAVDRLRALGLVDDAAYAVAYARARFERGGYGPQRVRADLMRRGVPRRLVESTLADVFDADAALVASAREQARRRWPRLAGEPDARKRRKKLHDFLLRRGFGYEVARQVVEELAREGR